MSNFNANQRQNWASAHLQQPAQYNANDRQQLATVGNVPHAQMTEEALMQHMKDERFFPYFGYGKGVIMPKSYSGVEQENFDLPDAYVGSNKVMSDIIITELMRKKMWGTHLAMPYKKLEGTMKITWDTWQFHDTLPTRTPHEAVSRLLSSTKESGGASIHRWGTAFIIEHGFWSTEVGKQHYAYQLMQIRNAVAFGAQLDVALSLLNPSNYVNPEDKYRNNDALRGPQYIARWFQNEITNWARVQKSAEGFMSIVDQAEQIMESRNGKKGNMMIVPAGTSKYINKRPENKYHFLSGGEFKTKLDETLSVDGYHIVQSYPHVTGEHGLPTDPNFRRQTIGEFIYILDAHLANVELKDRRTAMLDQCIYSQDKDDFYRLSYAVVIRFLGLYTGWRDEESDKPGDMPLTALGMKLFQGIQTWGEVYAKAERLGPLLRQLTFGTSDAVYREFINKFVKPNTLPETEEKTWDNDRMRDDQDEDDEKAGLYAHLSTPAKKNKASPSDTAVQASMKAGASSYLDSSFPKATFADTYGGTRARLIGLAKRLEEIDQKSSGSQRTSLAPLLAAGVLLSKQVQAIQSHGGESAEANTEIAYAEAIRIASNLLLTLDLTVATNVVARNPAALTALEKLVVKHGGWSYLTADDLDGLTAANASSPYWKPKGPTSKVAHVALVAPEPGAGDGASNSRSLLYASQALTLASHFVVLFNIPMATVDAYLQSKGDDNNPLGIAYHTPEVATSVSSRVHTLEFSIVLSCLYTLVMEAAKAPGAGLDPKQEAELVAKVLALRKSENIKDAMSKCAHMPVSNYQMGISTIINDLRAALLYLFNENETISAEKVASHIRGVILHAANIKAQNHLRNADVSCDAQSAVATQVGVFGDYQREGRKVDPVANAEFQSVVEKLRTELKANDAKSLLHAAREKAPLAKGIRDLTQYWRSVYLRIKWETRADEKQFKEYLAINDYLLHIKEYNAANGLNPAVADLVNADMKAICYMAGLDPRTSSGEIKAKLNGVAGDTPNNNTQLAMAWTRFFSRPKSSDYVTQQLALQPDDAAKKLYAINLCLASIKLDQLNQDALTAVLATKYKWSSGTDEAGHSHELYPFLFHVPSDPNVSGPVNRKIGMGRAAIAALPASVRLNVKDFDNDLKDSTADLASIETDMKQKVQDKDTALALATTTATAATAAQSAANGKAPNSPENVEMNRRNGIAQQARADAAAAIDVADAAEREFQLQVGIFIDEVCDSAKRHLGEAVANVLDRTLRSFSRHPVVAAKFSQQAYDVAVNTVSDIPVHAPASSPSPSSPTDAIERLELDVLKDILMTRISITDGYFWKWCCDNNIIPAIGMLGFRPHQTYEMGTMVMLIGGGATGYTFYGNPLMMMSDNAGTQMHYGHFTWYSKCVVMKPGNIVHARNIICRDYLGGAGHKVYDASPDSNDRQEFLAGEGQCDIFVVPVLMNHRVDTTFMDITGRFHPDIGADEEAQKLTAYESSAIYSEFWKWTNTGMKPRAADYSAVPLPTANTIVCQGHQNMYNPSSKLFDFVQTNRGHWGDRVYTGCGRARVGIDMYLEPVKYNNTNVIGITV